LHQTCGNDIFIKPFSPFLGNKAFPELLNDLLYYKQLELESIKQLLYPFQHSRVFQTKNASVNISLLAVADSLDTLLQNESQRTDCSNEWIVCFIEEFKVVKNSFLACIINILTNENVKCTIDDTTELICNKYLSMS